MYPMYYNPMPTVAEWQDYRTVYCRNETCQRLEQEIEIEILVENIDGNLEQFSYTCTECDHRNDFEIEIGNPESYYYTD
jgi:hypothetical protein